MRGPWPASVLEMGVAFNVCLCVLDCVNVCQNVLSSCVVGCVSVGVDAFRCCVVVTFQKKKKRHL